MQRSGLAQPRDAQRLGLVGHERVQLLGAQAVVDRDERDSGPCGSKQRHRKRRAVDREVQDRIGPSSADDLGPAPGQIAQPRSGELVSTAADDDAIAAGVGGHVEQEREIHRGLRMLPTRSVG
jgi:hypothetical protein